MKKLLSMLTIGTLVSTNIPNINIVLNTNLNKNNFDSSVKNTVNHQKQQSWTSTGIYHSNSGL